ncbi:ABC transporter substrate-binding periplasmic protein [Acetobacter pasteurianus NBRC 101655]|uniref:ABC transporter substrate-binding periplasmic protein n=1 Tax=Acetobacter pasteurianus NBRC 3278 TaxID=1226660 RepID=A0A401X569_ACEPA|nr:ABC transporter substrate-binding protein [Acetobacter pasteurianus]BAU39355.1 ABC transporter substrate-binding periplasmic protein [Acetobacter pasteurianus NBRC 101655]CCT59173.1 ABC transporter binding protein [Acetobacter pasteurianus 386B]GCD59469.1 ABC transporter substrate-binding periplasmic protein [Acetobacter pasteurianus NBRC 3277]GCD62974.1 ABC transporter substrate-binding periplasmic protein [Acetobacter pasteurianus NBRC 3278]GCD69347.1 ABC transporter substrate-binding per
MKGFTALLMASCCTALVAQAHAADFPSTIGKGEGDLNVVAWEGYADDAWVKPFEQQTGCKVHRKYVGSSDEMVALTRMGGGKGFDIVSASGDAALRLIFGHNVQPLNMSLIPAYNDLMPELKEPSFNTVKGVHYGISYEWGPNILMWNTKVFPQAPTSWGVIYDKAHAGVVTVPDNPIQIADAALYLSHTKPDLGITDPYELTQPQMDAVVALLKEQRALVKKYWALASDEVDLFKSGDAQVGSAWPYQANTLRAAGVPVQDTIPVEGATGWADSWMISAHAEHPNCAYLWINHVMTPKVQAQQALSFGETPGNTKACAEMDAEQPGACKQYHADASSAYFASIKFWKTPVKSCGNGQNNCLDYGAWQRAWQQVKQ